MNQKNHNLSRHVGSAGNIPKLRFPEFQDAEEWKEKQLEQICEVNPSIEKLPKRFVYIDLESVEDGVLLQKKNITLDGAPSRAQRLLKIGDVIFQMVRPYQKNNYFFQPLDDFDYVASTGYAQLRAHQSSMYLFQYLHHQGFVDKVLAKCTGSSYPAINSSDLSKILIEIPDFNEQQKIADCLSSIDELITAQSQKIDTLKTHKKGLMQQLFPAEGDASTGSARVPKLRFAEFRDDGEWEEKALGNLGEFTGGGTPSKANDSFWKGSIPWVSSSDIFEDSIHQIKISRFITEEALKDSATKLVPENSILIVSRVGVGKLAITKQPVCTSQDFTNFTPDKDNLMFLAYILKSHSKTLLKYSQGMAIKGFTKDDISKLNLFIPHLAEQQKIADCLFSLDELIAAQSQKLDVLKTHKKGLMQGLFPCWGDPAWSSSSNGDPVWSSM